MTSNYVIWKFKEEPNACILHRLSGVEKQYQLTKGVARAGSFPSDAVYTMDPDFPDDTVLTDNLINSDMLIVASNRLKGFLEARKLKKVEYLPVAILDYKGKPASRDYFIIHPIDPVDCLYIDQCEVEWGTIDKESIDSLARIVIDESKIDADRELFRPKYFYDVVLVRRELADSIVAAKFTGIRWLELSDYPEI